MWKEEQDWYVSIVDVIGVLADQPTQHNASTYWAVMKKRLLDEGAIELLTSYNQLKLKASDGKTRYKCSQLPGVYRYTGAVNIGALKRFYPRFMFLFGMFKPALISPTLTYYNMETLLTWVYAI